jgi:DNA (cytosine-5)-methyltransferase 1
MERKALETGMVLKPSSNLGSLKTGQPVSALSSCQACNQAIGAENIDTKGKKNPEEKGRRCLKNQVEIRQAYDLLQDGQMILATRQSKTEQIGLKRNLVGKYSQPIVVDLCCGMGGLSLAAKQMGMRICAGVDSNLEATKTFKNNFPGTEVLVGSVRSVKTLNRCKQLLKPSDGRSVFSIVVSGPPCQGFSMAGSRNPVDPRNQILVSVAKAISVLKPHCALIENVSMVFADRHRKRLKHFEATLNKAGYHVHTLLLDAAEFGVAQKRKRAFFLISKRKLGKTEVDKRLAQQKRPPVNSKRALTRLPTPSTRPDDYNDEQDYDGIPNHFAMRHSRRVKNKIAALEPGTGPMSYRRLHPARPSNTLFSGHRAPPAHFKEPRSITVREAARLQGFPDDFRVYGSFANQMGQVTNAVPPPLARAVLSVLVELARPPIHNHA